MLLTLLILKYPVDHPIIRTIMEPASLSKQQQQKDSDSGTNLVVYLHRYFSLYTTFYKNTIFHKQTV